MDDACVGPCNNRARRVWAAYDRAWQQWDQADHGTRGEPPKEPGVPIGYGRPWCAACTTMIRAYLANLDDLMSLRLTMADGYQAPAPTGERVRSSREQPSPSPAQDDLDALVRWLREQENAYRESQGWGSAPYRGVDAPALTGGLWWLGKQLDRMLQVEAVSETFGKGVLFWHRVLQAKTSTKPPLSLKPLPCPHCQRRSLYRHAADESVRCRSSTTVVCGAIMTLKEYTEYAEEADQQVIAS